jgi:hypothetical protein
MSRSGQRSGCFISVYKRTLAVRFLKPLMSKHGQRSGCSMSVYKRTLAVRFLKPLMSKRGQRSGCSISVYKRSSAVAVLAIGVHWIADRDPCRSRHRGRSHRTCGHRTGCNRHTRGCPVIRRRTIGRLDRHGRVHSRSTGGKMAHSPVVAFPLLDATAHPTTNG